ncbi:MAG: hypothetical protein ACFCUV_02115 [Rivularia sp. (in: cyanobacteria)]
MDNNQLFTELSSEEESSISGGAIPWALAWGGVSAAAWWVSQPGNGIYVDPDGNPNTRNNLVLGDFNRRGSQWRGAKWEIRSAGNTVAKGYGNVPNWLVNTARNLIRR